VSSRYGSKLASEPDRIRRRSSHQGTFQHLGVSVWIAIVLILVTGGGIGAYEATNASPTTPGSTGPAGVAPVGVTPPTVPNQGPAPSGLLTLHPGGSDSGHAGLNNVSCTSTTTCVAVGADAAGSGIAEVSTNGGTSFTSVAVPNGTKTLSALSCATATSTCVASDGTNVLTSSDGGNSWSSQHLAPQGVELLGAFCESASQCFVGGMQSSWVLGNHAEVFVSGDGGTTWTQATVPNNVPGVVSFACPSTSTCIGVGSGVVVSHDSGQTWNLVPVNGNANQLFSISCASAQSCIAVGPNPGGEADPTLPADAVLTTDGGNTFNAVTLPASSASVFEVSCTSSTCLASGAVGQGASAPPFVTSSDGGSSWANATAPPDFLGLSALDCMSSGPCVATGSQAAGPATTVEPSPDTPGTSWTVTPASTVQSVSSSSQTD
jgi:photosystem II stability/assembly factor-like uncharacterized protein